MINPTRFGDKMRYPIKRGESKETAALTRIIQQTLPALGKRTRTHLLPGYRSERVHMWVLFFLFISGEDKQQTSHIYALHRRNVGCHVWKGHEQRSLKPKKIRSSEGSHPYAYFDWLGIHILPRHYTVRLPAPQRGSKRISRSILYQPFRYLLPQKTLYPLQ